MLLPFAQSDMEADGAGLPGDNFSLEAAIELFKKSSSPEDFEKRLNSENNDANNLDLNEDGEIDYIRVVDNMDGDVHALVLQVAVSEKESQDVAVIEIEKQGAENAILQIIGDEALYGEQTITKPFGEEKVKNGKDKGPAAERAPVRIVVNVWLWPSVRFMYAPAYRVWVSPWRWRVYPGVLEALETAPLARVPRSCCSVPCALSCCPHTPRPPRTCRVCTTIARIQKLYIPALPPWWLQGVKTGLSLAKKPLPPPREMAVSNNQKPPPQASKKVKTAMSA